jgi:hypothetical protein
MAQMYHGATGRGEDYAIHTSWRVEDVRVLKPDISTEDAISVLNSALDTFDANDGITWETLQFFVDGLEGSSDE